MASINNHQEQEQEQVKNWLFKMRLLTYPNRLRWQKVPNEEKRNLIADNMQKHIDVQVRKTSKTPYVAIDERGLVRSIHLFLFSCVH